MSSAIVLDAGALIAIERRSRRIQTLILEARRRNVTFVVPTAVVAQVVRAGGRQADLRRFLGDSALRYVGLDLPSALEIGTLLTGSGSTDVVDGFVVVCARHHGGCPVVTSDADDIARLDPSLPLIRI